MHWPGLDWICLIFFPSNYYKICFPILLLYYKICFEINGRALFIHIKTHFWKKKSLQLKTWAKIQHLWEEGGVAFVMSWAWWCVWPQVAARCGKKQGEPALIVLCFYPQRAGEPVLRMMIQPTHAWIIPSQPPSRFLPSSSLKLYLLHFWLGSRGFLAPSWLTESQVFVAYLLTSSPLGEGLGEKRSTLQDQRKQDRLLLTDRKSTRLNSSH